MQDKDDRNLNILTLWFYWIIVGEPDKRDSLNRKEERFGQKEKILYLG